MARALWNGTLSFGMVHIPVSLHSNEKKKEFDFGLIDRRDHAPIGHLRVNKSTGQEVGLEDIVRSYKLTDGNYVVVPEEEFKRVNPEFTRTIRIASFATLEEVSPVYFETPYYLEPERDGEKGYALLLHALSTLGKIGIARTVLRHRERIAALIPERALLSLVTLRYAHELRHPARLNQPAPDLDALGLSLKEVDLARRLVEQMSAPWKPLEYRDEYREHVLGYIRRKAAGAGGEPAAALPPPASKPTPEGKLLAQLERSLAGDAEAKPRRKSKPA